MSLKAFHIVFVTAATLLAAGTAVWGFGQGTTWLGVGAAVAALALPVYGWWFLGKMRSVNYL